MKVLISGGAGFIGSTIAHALDDANHVPVIIDDLSTGREEFVKNCPLFVGDIGDGDVIDEVFSTHADIDLVVHCAAKILVPESITDPIGYYRNNVSKSCEFAAHLIRNGCHRIIFSSSASVYRTDGPILIDEDSPLGPLSPYARTKVACEAILEDISTATTLRSISLRYFNPIGADPQLRSGLQTARPTHALGNLIAAHNSRGDFEITGTDYDTRDGSGIRDYVHVWDVARAHVLAAEQFDSVVNDHHRFDVMNIGSGHGTTVKELIAAFERVIGQPVSVVVGPRRPGDVRGVYSAYTKANHELGWQPTLSLQQAIEDAFAWSERRLQMLGI